LERVAAMHVHLPVARKPMPKRLQGLRVQLERLHVIVRACQPSRDLRGARILSERTFRIRSPNRVEVLPHFGRRVGPVEQPPYTAFVLAIALRERYREEVAARTHVSTDEAKRFRHALKSAGHKRQ